MDANPPPARPSQPSRKRPTWQRVLVWVGIIFLAVNILPLLLFLLPQQMSDSLLSRFALFCVFCIAFMAISVPFGGLNLLRTASNLAKAEFRRRDDPASGGYAYDVRPARISWLSILLPLPLFAFLAAWAVFATWILYVVAACYFLFAAIFVMPGARYRRPATILVSPNGISSDDIDLPLDRVAEIELAYNGLRLSEDPLMPGLNGVSTSAMIGRGLGRRQAARSFSVTLRGEGESSATVLAGGLTEDCARTLGRDLLQTIARLRDAPTRP